MKLKVKKIITENYKQILTVFLAFLLMVLISYFYASYIVQKQILTIGEETMNTTQMSVSAGLSEAELIFSNVTQNLQEKLVNGANNQEILTYLEGVNYSYVNERSLIPDFLKIYASIREEFLDGSGWVPFDGYIPSERPWYIGAAENEGQIFFTDPYVDADTGGMCISFSQQLFDNDDNPYGVVAIDLNLTRIIDYIANLEIANNGYGVLVDDKMYFTTHRNQSLIGTKLDEANGDYKKLELMLAEQSDISAQRFTDADGTDSIAFFRTIFNGWHIGIIIPRTHYYKPVYQLGIVLSSLGCVLMLILSYMLVRFHTDKMRSEEESRSKSNFLARMSHEMRTPMNAIIGMINIAKKSDSIDEVQRCLGKINDSANHLLGIINDVLDVSKIEAGKMELSETDFRFTDMITQVTTVMNFKLEEKHQNFYVQMDENVPTSIITDKQRLAQVITNLLSNANKFAPEGGNIRLSVHKTEESGNKCTLQIEVEDDGIGISEEQQARLFRSFEQADNSISRKYGGTGLGLAISKNLINMMDGDIWIDSKLGKGARFIFTIVVGVGVADEEESHNTGMCYADNKDMFAGKHILLVDDVDINREILITLLDDSGVGIDCAENGREACDKYAANPEIYDMIFMDIHMPEMNGYEATQTIRKMDITGAQTIPIIAMTANVFREDIEKCLLAGMNDHIGKPLDINTVIDKMKQYLF